MRSRKNKGDGCKGAASEGGLEESARQLGTKHSLACDSIT